MSATDIRTLSLDEILADDEQRLTPIGKPFYIRSKGERRLMVVCECRCGEICVSVPCAVASRKIRSCGCSRRTHGMSRRRSPHPLYVVWISMRRRCSDSTYPGFHNYGGRGISVCKEWNENFEPFHLWAESNGWSRGLEIDRIDNNGNYCPENCRFVTKLVNSHNRRTNVFLSAFGETKCVTAWARDDRCAVSLRTLMTRIRSGMSPEMALSTPKRNRWS